jgi:hypothetical protein
MSTTDPDVQGELRQQAVQRLRVKAAFRKHLVVFLSFNAFLVLIWALTGAGFFWPVFPIAGWGIAVALNAWEVYGPDPITEDRIRREIDRMRRSAGEP